ncbi:hypothetical protein [Bacillus atrophaeus]|uniref:hypothetical protein n=1 Tax=Bacillus atrophaeus TaxID=1452 RepID=UPI002E20EE35|nr:hypothetical protein [Bacillus atrophaeus]
MISLNKTIEIKERKIELANRSTFPQQIDTFTELFDLPPTKVASAKRFQELKQKPTLNSTEQDELNALVVDLGNYIITPETWNKFADALVNVQVFFTQEVMKFIEAKQVLWDTYVKNFTYKGVYISTTQYKYQNMTTYNGDLYLCIKDSKGISPEDEGYWQKISTKGDKGDIGLNTYYKGDFDNSASYVLGDAVTFEGNLYYAKGPTTGVAPTDTTKWMLFENTVVSKSFPPMSQKGMFWIEILD